MYDFLLTDQQLRLRDEVRDLVRWVPREMILAMDRDEIRFPKEFLREAGRRNLMGCRGGGTGRLELRNVEVPRENLIGNLDGGTAVFNTMMIPERLGTAAMTIGAARPALEIATTYSSKRKAFGRTINQLQGVSFQVAEAAMLLDASRSMAYTTARAVDTGVEPNRVRRLVSESKRFITDSCQRVVHNAMQVMGGVGYTNVFPVERIFRDLRLASIWTGTNEVMSAIVAHEWYRENQTRIVTRDAELDAAEADAVSEKVYGD